MARYDRKRLSGNIERKRRGLSSISDDELRKEVEHTQKLLEHSLPMCLRKRTETILASEAPNRIETELERFNYEAYWFELLLEYERHLRDEGKRRKIA